VTYRNPGLNLIQIHISKVVYPGAIKFRRSALAVVQRGDYTPMLMEFLFPPRETPFRESKEAAKVLRKVPLAIEGDCSLLQVHTGLPDNHTWGTSSAARRGDGWSIFSSASETSLNIYSLTSAEPIDRKEIKNRERTRFSGTAVNHSTPIPIASVAHTVKIRCPYNSSDKEKTT